MDNTKGIQSNQISSASKYSNEAILEKLIHLITWLVAAVAFIACWVYTHDPIMAMFDFPTRAESNYMIPMLFPLHLLPYAKLILLCATSSFISMVTIYHYFGVSND